MTAYDDINLSISNCIASLEENKFSGGALQEIQELICNVANDVKDLNNYAKSIDDRVVALEAIGQQ